VNNNELRKLNRKELLEILVSQAELIDELEKELDKTKKELNNKTIIIKEAGSIAEASLKLSGIFEKAQEIADEYLNSIKAANSVDLTEESESSGGKSTNLENRRSECVTKKIKKTRRRKITA